MIRFKNKTFSFIFIWLEKGLIEFSILEYEEKNSMFEWNLFNFCYCNGDIFIQLFGKEFTLRER